MVRFGGGRRRGVRGAPFPMSSLPITVQIDVFARMGLRELIHMMSVFTKWSDVLSPMIDEKTLLEDLQKKMVEVIELMQPKENMSTALIRNCIAGKDESKFMDLVSSLVLSLTIPERLFAGSVDYKNWFREDIEGLLARVKMAMQPASIVRRIVYWRRRKLIDHVLELMMPSETMSEALKRIYYGKDLVLNENLAHFSVSLLLEFTTPAAPLIDTVDYQKLSCENIKQMFDKQEESDYRCLNFCVREMLIGLILSRMKPGYPLSSLLDESNTLFEMYHANLMEDLSELMPFLYPDGVDTSKWLREDVENLIPRLEKEMLVARIFDDIYGAQ